MRAAQWTIAVASMAVAFGTAAAGNGWVTLRGKALSQAFANQDFGDDVHFAYQFLEGGELRGMNMGKPAQGRWRVAGSQLCWRWTKSGELEECYAVRRQGRAVRLFVNEQEVLSGDLTSLPANRVEPAR